MAKTIVMTRVATAIGGVILFALGGAITLGAEHLFFKRADQRDAMQTSVRLQDWNLSCQPRTTKNGICIVQAGVVQKGNVVAELTVAPKDHVDNLTIVAPLGVFIPAGVKVDIGSTVSKSIAFKTCLNVGCVAIIPVDTGLASAMTQNAGGQLTLVAADGKSVPLNFSLRGYADAISERATDMAARK